MGHLMVIKIARRRESLPANSALVRFFAAMDPPMSVETRRRGEPLLANITDMGPFSGVDSHVPFEQRRSVKGFSAVVARQ